MANAITPSVPSLPGLIRGNGIVYKEYGESSQREIGATKGDIVITIDREFSHADYNGQYGHTEGLKTIDKSQPMIKFPLLDLTYANFEDCFAGLVVSDEGAYHKIVEDLAIAAGDYHENITFAGQNHAAKYCRFKLFNALGDGKIELSVKDKENIVTDIQFTGHYGTASPTTPPWEFDIED